MLTVARAHLFLMFNYLKYNFIKEMSNRGSFITQIIFTIIDNVFFIIQWIILFSLKSSIGGYSFGTISVLIAFVSCIFGVSHLFFENIFYLPELISSGKLDAYIVQPKSILFNVSVARTAPAATSNIVFGYILFLTTVPSLPHIILFSIVMLLGAVCFTAFFIIIGSLTFWLKKGDALLNSINFIMLSFPMYPEGIFKGITRIVLYSVFPVGLIFYVPVNLLTDFKTAYLFIIPIISTIFVWSAVHIFNLGLKKYSSSCLIGIRL